MCAEKNNKGKKENGKSLSDSKTSSESVRVGVVDLSNIVSLIKFAHYPLPPPQTDQCHVFEKRTDKPPPPPHQLTNAKGAITV